MCTCAGPFSHLPVPTGTLRAARVPPSSRTKLMSSANGRATCAGTSARTCASGPSTVSPMLPSFLGSQFYQSQSWRGRQIQPALNALLSPPAAICPPGWLSFSGSCYWLVSNVNLLTTWHEAHTQCSGMGAHLLIVNR